MEAVEQTIDAIDERLTDANDATEHKFKELQHGAEGAQHEAEKYRLIEKAKNETGMADKAGDMIGAVKEGFKQANSGVKEKVEHIQYEHKKENALYGRA